MDAVEKAVVRLEHWIAHNENHQLEYQRFAVQLEEAGQRASAAHVRDMIELSQRSNACLQLALEALER